MDSQLKQQFQQIKILIDGASTILVATHEKPDGDGIGASLALASVLKNQGKNCFCFCPDSVPPDLVFLPQSNDFQIFCVDKPFDLVFGLDYGRFGRLGKIGEMDWFDEKKFISIDHHPLQDQRGEVKIILPKLSSTSEIIYWFLRQSGFGITEDVATCLLTGIFTDTGGFKHAATKPLTLKIVGDLITRGADLGKISSAIFSQKSLHSLKVRGLVLSRIQYDKESGIAYSWISSRDFDSLPADFDDIDGLPQIINTISGSSLALFMSEDEPGDIYCSVRSEPFKNTNVAKIAESFGGGGHPYAAGFRFKGTFKDALESVKMAVRRSEISS